MLEIGENLKDLLIYVAAVIMLILGFKFLNWKD